MLKKQRRFIKLFFVLSLFALAMIAYVYNASPRKITFTIPTEKIFEDENLRVDQIGSIPRLAVSYSMNGDVYATEDHYVLKKGQKQDVFAELGYFRKLDRDITSRARDFIARMRITRDLRKNFGANDCVVLKSGTILVFYDKIYRSVDQGISFQSVFDFRENNILQPSDHGIAVDENDDVYFGEYNCGQRPHPIRMIKGSRDGTVWSIFYEFPSGEIFHIHSIKYDPFRELLWVASGDTDEESKLMYIDKGRKGMRVLGGGDQGWRIVSLMTTKDFLYWCSDNDRTGSSIYRYNFANRQREGLAFVGKPSYYSTQLRGGTLAFSTTFEPESDYSNSFHPEPTTDLWISKNGKDWVKVLSLAGKIDKLAHGLSRPSILLPSGDYSADDLFLTPMSTLTSDFSTKVLRITWKR